MDDDAVWRRQIKCERITERSPQGAKEIHGECELAAGENRGVTARRFNGEKSPVVARGTAKITVCALRDSSAGTSWLDGPQE